ncbi:MAG: hypothetical protein KGI26_04855 [Thaumarchaeota archaeon]|nr:hypothetical protein [Nitrososphaerota archaeon]
MNITTTYFKKDREPPSWTKVDDTVTVVVSGGREESLRMVKALEKVLTAEGYETQ